MPPPPPSVTHQGHIIAVHQHPGHLPQVGVNGMPPNVGYYSAAGNRQQVN